METNGLISIAERLADLAATRSNDVLLECLGTTRTATEIEVSSNRLANFFASLGVKADDFVTIALPNSTMFVESVFAIWKLGATPQPVSPKLPGAELEAIEPKIAKLTTEWEKAAEEVEKLAAAG